MLKLWTYVEPMLHFLLNKLDLMQVAYANGRGQEAATAGQRLHKQGVNKRTGRAEVPR